MIRPASRPRARRAGPTRRAALLRGAVIGATLLPLPGCGDDAPPPPALVRLFDDARLLECEGPVDLSTREALLASSSETILDDDCTAVPPDRFATFTQPDELPLLRVVRPGSVDVGDWDDATRLRLAGPALYLRHLEVAVDRPVRVEVDLLLRERAAARVFVAERLDPPGADELRTVKLARHLLEFELERTHPLHPEAADDVGRTRFSTLLAPGPGARALVLGVLCETGACAVERVVVRAVAPIAHAALATAEGHLPPYRRSVERGREQRESLLVAAGGALRLAATAPARSPALHFGVLGLDLGPAPEYRVLVSAKSRAGEVEREVVVAAEAEPLRHFQDFTVDLAELAGEPLELRFAVTSADGLGVAIGAPTLEPGSADPERPRPMDVVIVSLDTVRADRLHAWGAESDPTPALTALAADAVLFEQAISASAWTLPSHVTILSGQLPERHRVESEHARLLLGRAPLLATELRKRGYRTWASTGGGFVQPSFGLAEGFERFGSEDPAFPPLAWAEEAAPAQVPRARASLVERKRLLSVLRGGRNRPLFCFAHTYVAHNYQVPAALLRELGAPDSDIPRLLLGLNQAEVGAEIERGAPPQRVAQLRADAERLYEGGLRLADDFLGAVVGALREGGHLDHTLLIVLSDHGEELLERGTLGHRHSLYDELVRVPLLVRAPGVAPTRVADQVSLADVAPTVRDLLDLPPPRLVVDGVSLAPLLAGARRNDPAFASTLREDGMYMRAVRRPEAKLVQVENRKQRESAWALYRLASDRREQRDMSRFHPLDVEELRKVLDRHTAALAQAPGAAEDATLSADVIRELKELGYLGGR